MRNALIAIMTVGLAASAAAAPGASTETSLVTGPVEGVRIQYRVDPRAAEEAEALGDAIADGTISRLQLNEAKNAKLFLHLAAGARDSKIVAVALEGMGRTWSRTGRHKRPKVDKDFTAVVGARLADRSGLVQANALAAARLLVGGAKPDPGFLKRVLKMATSGSPAARVAALDALFNVRDFQVPKKWNGKVKKQITAAHLANLDHKNSAVVVASLKNLARAGFPAMPQKAKIQAKARSMAADAKPEVRGSAILLVGSVASTSELAGADGALIMAALSDKHPFVRACGATAIGRAGFQAGIHGLVGLFDDASSTRLEVKGFKALDGQAGVIRVPVYADRVDESALRALEELTKATKAKFEFPTLRPKVRDEGRAKAVARARAWYADNSKSLPKAPTVAAPQAPKAPAAVEAPAAPVDAPPAPPEAPAAPATP